MSADARRVKELFGAALECPDAAARAAFLDRECGDDAELRRRLEQLLFAHDHPESALERPLGAPAETLPYTGPTESAGAVIAGRYKLLERLGEGGMGEVWVADQLEPIKRRVAIKLIKPGMDSRAVLARFEAERQALALMDHPNIARVLDASATDDGRPYFVMELVKGTPITQFCDERKLSTRERLELFVPVCQAIQHAHQKGIIHRDIKPSNVLVALHDEKPVPKVIDFGVAKAIGQQLTEKTLYTGFGALVGTPSYMAPEQATFNQLDIDTRADIYSLGVLLYELLAGSPPFEPERLKKAALDEVLRLVREEEPPRPSARLSTSETKASIAAVRQSEPARLSNLLRGELDCVVMKALEKDRNRRYETANGLAMDLQRYLAGEAVQAVPPSAGYRLRKFARRNKGGLAVSALVLFFLLLLGGGAGWAVRDREVRRTRFATELGLILDDARQGQAEHDWPKALLAARRAESLVAGGGGDAALEQQVHELLADLNLVMQLEEIRSERTGQLATERNAAWVDRAYAAAFSEAGMGIGGHPSVAEVVERLRSRKAVTVALATALDDWAYSRVRNGDEAGATTLQKAALEADPDPCRRRVRQAMHRKDFQLLEDVALSVDLLHQPPTTVALVARFLLIHGKRSQAVTLLRKAQRQHPDDFWINFQLGEALEGLEGADRQEALGFYRVAVGLRPRSAGAWYGVGRILADRPELNEATAWYRRAIELHPNNARFHTELAILRQREDDVDEAMTLYWKALELDPASNVVHRRLVNLIRNRKDRDETIAFFKRLVDAHPRNTRAHWFLGTAFWYANRIAESLEPFRMAAELDPNQARHHHSLANSLRVLGRLDEAIDHYSRAATLAPGSAEIRHKLGVALQRQGRLVEAIASWRLAVQADQTYLPAHTHLSWHLATAADAKLRDARAAVEHARAAVALAPNAANQRSNLGVALLRAGEFQAAVEALETADRMVMGGDLAHRFFLAMAYGRTAQTEKALGAYRQGLEWMERHRPTDEELRLFRAEAEELLKLESKSRSDRSKDKKD